MCPLSSQVLHTLIQHSVLALLVTALRRYSEHALHFHDKRSVLNTLTGSERSTSFSESPHAEGT